MNGGELQRRAAALQMSSTMTNVCTLAARMSDDMSDDDSLKAAFSTCLIDMVEAVDNGDIQFGTDEARAMFHGLLALALKAALGGGDLKFEKLVKQ